MARLPRGLAVFGFVVALAGAAQLAAAAPTGKIHLAQDDVNPDMPTDAPADAPADMPAETPTDVATATSTATPTVTSTATPTSTPTPNPTVIASAIQQVIQRSNDEQVQAVQTSNLSLMADMVTADRFQELTKTIQDMLDSHVYAIVLVKLEWGPITVAADGSGATATTYEAWRINSQAGTIDYDPVRNDYTLVRDNATWKVKSDVQVFLPPQRTGTVVPTQ